MNIFSFETAGWNELTFPFCVAGGDVVIRRAAMMDDDIHGFSRCGR